MSFVLLVPFAQAIRGLDPHAGFVWGLAFGSAIWGAATWWMHNAFAAMLHLPGLSAWTMTALFWLYQALPYAGLGWLYAWMHKRAHPPGPLLCACVFTLLAALRTAISPGTVHQTLASWPCLIQTAELGGRHLLLLLLVLGNWLLAEAVVKRAEPARAIRCLAAFALLLAMLLGYGAWRLERLHSLEQQAGRTDFVSVTALQPVLKPLPATGKISPELPALADKLIALTRQAEADAPAAELVLWPEVPQELPCDCPAFQRLDIPGAAAAYGAPILLSCTEFLKNAGKYNAAWAVRPSGYCGMAYRKIELVPFGEFMPLGKWLRRLGLAPGDTGHYRAGRTIRLLQLQSGKRVQPLICYESGFPQLVRQGVDLGADLLAVLSDDIWFASAKAEAMHLDMTLFRAVEVRRPLVSCTNSGIGAHVRSTGEIVPGTRTSSGERTATTARLHCPAVRTLYARIGDGWLWLAALCVAVRLFSVRHGVCDGARGKARI